MESARRVSSSAYLQNLREKLRHGGPLRLVLDALGRMRIQILPYYLIRENSTARVELPGEKAFEVASLQREDMHLLADIPARTHDRVDRVGLLERMDAGNRCLALIDGDRVAAFCWADLAECAFSGFRFELEEDAAYLFDAYTLPEYRGLGLAPYLRCQFYRELTEIGRTDIYSISAWFNKPAIRFKEKLGARPVHLGVEVKIFGALQFTWVLKRYPPRQPAPG